jgi:hypothetical protein
MLSQISSQDTVDVEQWSTIGKEEGEGNNEERNSRKICLKKRNATMQGKANKRPTPPDFYRWGARSTKVTRDKR